MFYVFKLALIGIITAPAALLTLLIGPFDRHGKHVYHISRFWTWVILKLSGVSLNVLGLEQIHPRRAYVFMSNHQSNIDIPVLIQSLIGHQLRWIAKKELLWIPFFGWALWAAKHIPVDRRNARSALKSLRTARERIHAGISVVVFPEGTRSKDGRLLQFKKGGVLLALQTGAPIVPVTINGTRKVLPAGAWRLQPGTVEVVIGEPLAVAGGHLDSLRELSTRVREAVEKHLQAPAAAMITTFRADRRFVIHTSPENWSVRN
jgi:1-acyl-sn-glycerol-3-phosphate acyltransferase